MLSKKIRLQILSSLLFGLVITEPVAAKDATSLPTYAMRTSLFETLHEHRDIVMLGDSLTARGEWGEFYPGASIANRGIGGDTTTGVLSRINQILEMRPKVVFILAGINDLAHHQDTPKILANYHKVIETLTSSGTEVVVQSTLYVSKRSRLSDNTDITQINDGLKAYCLNKNKCQFIDLNSSMSASGKLNHEYTGDGIHLNGKGYLAWREAISATMAKYLPADSRQ